LLREGEDPRDQRDGLDPEARLARGLLERETSSERLAEDDLRAIIEADRREQIAVAAEAEDGALLGARGRRHARCLINAARDQRREEPRPCARLLGVADA